MLDLSFINPGVLAVIVLIVGGILGYRYYRRRELLSAVASGKIPPPVENKSKKPEYKAYVWLPVGRIEPRKINDRIGNEIFVQPSFPQSGSNLLLMLDDKGSYKPYDTRFEGMKEGDSPTDCYEAVVCPEVADVYVDLSTLWEKFRALIPYLIAGSMALILLVIVDKIMSRG